MERVVAGLFDNRNDAVRAVNALSEYDMPQEVVSVLMHEGIVHDEDLPNPATQSRERAVRGGLFGAAIGALLGGLVLGPFELLGVGPLGAALFAAIGGAFYGTLAGALTGRDEPKAKVKMLEDQVTGDKILVTVDVASGKVADDVAKVFQDFGAAQVQTA